VTVTGFHSVVELDLVKAACAGTGVTLSILVFSWGGNEEQHHRACKWKINKEKEGRFCCTLSFNTAQKHFPGQENLL